MGRSKIIGKNQRDRGHRILHGVRRFQVRCPKNHRSDNGSQFVGNDFEKVLSDLKIQHSKALVAYPQSNGHVEITNKAIL